MPVKNKLCYFVYGVLLVVFLLQSFFYRNFILSEEHHYLEVASNLFYHPHAGMLKDTMGLYLSKPPLLFWMLSGLWTLLGAHNWVIHFLLMSVLAGILCSTQYLYQILFDNPKQAALAPVIVLGSFLFFSRGTIFCFDSLVVLFFVLSAIGIVLALKHAYIRGFILYGFAVGLGVLTKGPIILAFCLPFFIVATVLRRAYGVRDRRWFFGFVVSVLIIIVLLTLWLIPVLQQLSPVRQRMLLLHRGFGVGDTYGHVPFYFYVKTCLFLFLPWLLWPYGVKSFFDALRHTRHPAFKLVFYSLLLSLVILSIIPPKALRYVMSSVVLFAILYVYALCQNKPVFNLQSDGARGVLKGCVGIIVLVEIMTLCFPHWAMSKINYPTISYAWVVFFESIMLVSGGVLALLPKGQVAFEAIRLSAFACVLVFVMVIVPHEVLSENFPYQAFVIYVNDLKKQGIPIIYCRAYGGYQYSMTEPRMPDARYSLAVGRGQHSAFVYLIARKNSGWSEYTGYLYRLIDPSQGSVILIRKVPANKFVGLPFKGQRC